MDAERRSWTAASLVAATLLVATLAACAGAAGPGAREPSQTALVLLDCEVADASVWVDDRYLGEIGPLSGGVALAPGTRRIEVRHDRYHTYYARIALDPHERKTLQVHLAPELP